MINNRSFTDINKEIRLVRNLSVVSENGIRVNKILVHEIINLMKTEFKFSIVSLQINFIFSDTIWNINKEYLRHDYSTDIITFNYSGDTEKLDGEIFISIDDAAVNASKYSCSRDNEVLRLIIHGILHLLGYDDMNASDRSVMKKAENKLTKHFEYLLENGILIYDCKNCRSSG